MTMDPLAEVVEDLDAAIERLRAAPSVRMERRAMREALGHLYALRAHRQSQQRSGVVYRDLAHSIEGGRTTEGVLFLRGQLAHHLTRGADPQAKAFLGHYIGEYIGDGNVALGWRLVDELPPEAVAAAKPDQLAAYRTAVANRSVSGTLVVARDFVVASPLLPPLDATGAHAQRE